MNINKKRLIINVYSITAVRRLLPRTSFGVRKFFDNIWNLRITLIDVKLILP